MATDSPIAFLKQSIKDFRSVGALAPSGLFLARAIAKTLPEKIPDNFKVMEVGAGTGSVSVELIKRMNGRGQLELWEISPDFCRVLRSRLSREASIQGKQDRVTIHEGDVLTAKGEYDLVVSGLPFSNFRPEEVQGFLEHFRSILKPKGTLIWFEYVAVRKIQIPFVSKATRERLKQINEVTNGFIHAHQYKQEIIPINLPPARIRHLKFG
jgi:phospholipid N-methyltransferase